MLCIRKKKGRGEKHRLQNKEALVLSLGKGGDNQVLGYMTGGGQGRILSLDEGKESRLAGADPTQKEEPISIIPRSARS